ncbi:MAG: glutamyl-tRNA reductase [Bacteroidota bacterium]
MSHDVSRFFLVGLSFKKANLQTREAFSLKQDAMEALLKDHLSSGAKGAMVISTCNRTELYAFAPSAQFLKDLLIKHSKGSLELFEEVAYIKESTEAIRHLFRVGSGLESQIVGDFQIIGQVKQGFELAKSLGNSNTFLERLVNGVIKSSKRIKNETGLSSGTTSLAYAAVQAIRNRWENRERAPQILLYGVGKIGRATCDNLYRKFPKAHITLINRTQTRAEEMAMRYPVNIAPVQSLSEVVDQSDVIVVATGSEQATLREKHLGEDAGEKLLIDLSVPRNIDPILGERTGIELIDVNGLAGAINSDLDKRKTEIPKAESIVEETEAEFSKWLEKRKYAPTLKTIRENLQEIKVREIKRLKAELPEEAKDQVDLLTNRIILKITRQVALHLSKNPEKPEESLKTIESIFSLREENKAS